MRTDKRKRRRVSALAAQHQHVVSMLKRTIVVMLPAWLAYFFAVTLFAKKLNAVAVPYLDIPLATYLVIQGCALMFTIVLFVLARASVLAGRS
jgi:putative solute:sodium symporter small subunit